MDQINSQEHQAAVSKSKKTKMVFIALMVLVFLTGLLLFVFIGEAKLAFQDSVKYQDQASICQQDKKELEDKISKQCPNLAQQLPLKSNIQTPTLIPRETIDIPANDSLVLYNSKCEGFGNIKFFYPASWKIGINGEDSVTDGYEDTPEGRANFNKQCSLLIGYPVPPSGRQDDWTPGLRAELNIQAYPSENSFIGQKVQTIDELEAGIKEEMKSYNLTVLDMDRQTINNQKFVVLTKVYDDFARYERSWRTLKNDMIYEFTITILDPKTLDPVDSGIILDTGNKFMAKIEIK